MLSRCPRISTWESIDRISAAGHNLLSSLTNLRRPEFDSESKNYAVMLKMFFHFRESFLRLAASRVHRFSDVDTVFYLSIYSIWKQTSKLPDAIELNSHWKTTSQTTCLVRFVVLCSPTSSLGWRWSLPRLKTFCSGILQSGLYLLYMICIFLKNTP